jgi:hypothetical protein
MGYKNKKWLIIIPLIWLSFPIFSQNIEKRTINENQLWLGYFNQTRLSNKAGVWLDVHHRRKDNLIKRPTQQLFRPAIIYYLKDNIRFYGGYVYSLNYPEPEQTTLRPEHRPWQQFWWTKKYSAFSTVQYIRLEQRFVGKVINDKLINDYTFNYRARYNFTLFVPMLGKEIKPGVPFLFVIDEVFVNFGKEITNNYFDQNRFFTGVGYQFSQHTHMQLGYLNILQQKSSGDVFNNINGLRLFLLHNFDFRKIA